MHKDEVKGKMKDAEGRVQEAWGALTDDPEHEAEGEMKQAEGKFRETVGTVKEKLHRAID